MAEIEYTGARALRASIADPQALLALSLPDRKPAQDFRRASLKEGMLQRPKTAPLRVTGQVQLEGPGDRPASPDIRVYGRQSLFDKQQGGTAHNFLGPAVLRDLDKPRHGFPLKGPDRFLKQGDGHSLRVRVKLKELLKRHPVDRDPPFKKGKGGVQLSWESVPSAQSLFRYLYENGTIDFVSLRWGTSTNEVVWGRRGKPGSAAMYWGDRPTEVEVARWLPIFLEGIREYEEPFRFLAIMGSHDLIEEAGAGLHLLAAEMIPPFKKALDTREPTVVTIAVELMKAVLSCDPEVGKVWVHYIGHFSQIFNLFLSRGYLVNMGYNSHRIRSIKSAIQELLTLMQQYGGDEALPLMRRYVRTDPIVTDATMQRQRQQSESKASFKPWAPYTLI